MSVQYAVPEGHQFLSLGLLRRENGKNIVEWRCQCGARGEFVQDEPNGKDWNGHIQEVTPGTTKEILERGA